MPIIGAGDLASAIIDREHVTFFASGVSNSRETNVDVYNREIRLLKEQPKERHLVYFSSLSIYYGKGMYVDHKKCMESYIINTFPCYTIMRLGNISWGNNPHTLINYLKAHPEAEIQKVYRHIVDKDEFQYWLSMIRVGEKDIMNITGYWLWVPDLVNHIKNGAITVRQQTFQIL